MAVEVTRANGKRVRICTDDADAFLAAIERGNKADDLALEVGRAPSSIRS
jgi:hypothetical protein